MIALTMIEKLIFFTRVYERNVRLKDRWVKLIFLWKKLFLQIFYICSLIFSARIYRASSHGYVMNYSVRKFSCKKLVTCFLS